MRKTGRYVFCGTVFALCVFACLLLYHAFTTPSGTYVFVSWDRAQLQLANGEMQDVDLYDDLFTGKTYVLTATLNDRVENPHMVFSVDDADVRLFLEDELLFSYGGGGMTSADVDLPQDYLGKTLSLYYRHDGGGQCFLPSIRITNWMLTEADYYAYANITGIAAGFYAMAFLLLSGLVLLRFGVGTVEWRLVPLVFAFQLLTFREIASGQGVYFLPNWAVTALLWEPLSYVPLLLMGLFVVLNRKHTCWRYISLSVVAIVLVLALLHGASLLAGQQGLMNSFIEMIAAGDSRRMVYWAQVLMVYVCLAAALMIVVSETVQHESQRRALAVREAAAHESLEALHAGSRRVASMRHEMKNHIGVLHLLYQQGKLDQLGQTLTQLNVESALLPDIHFTDNAVMNAVLNSHAVHASELGIHFEGVALTPENTGIEDVDLHCLLSNMLDNALEACRRMTEGERYVRFRAEKKNGFLAISCLNSMPKNAVTLDTLHTSKSDAENHGFGIAQMKNIAAKYNSILDIQISQDTFCVKTALCCKEEATKSNELSIST